MLAETDSHELQWSSAHACSRSTCCMGMSLLHWLLRCDRLHPVPLLPECSHGGPSGTAGGCPGALAPDGGHDLQAALPL